MSAPKPSNSSAPAVSVIVANYNGATYLAEAIESVRRQSLVDLEIIVSDDASTDNSVTIATGLMAQDGRIRLLQSEHNGGPSAARNRALAVAKGEWIAVMDSDDLMHPERLAKLVEAACRDGADIVADDLIQFSSDDSLPPQTLLTGPWARGPTWVDIVDYIKLNQLYGAGPMLGYLKPLIRASALRALASGYDEMLRIGEDYDLVLRLLHSGNRMRVYALPLYFYRKHDSSISHRLNERVLVALKVANQCFFNQISESDPRLIAAVVARTRSLQTALAYEQLLTALKTRDWSGSARIALIRPQAAVLLRLPVGVRLRRLLPWRSQCFRSRGKSQSSRLFHDNRNGASSSDTP